MAPNERNGPGSRGWMKGAWSAWILLIGLLVCLLLGALTFDRSRWSSLVGDEATYLMMAESLAWDFDLEFEREDFDRFVAHWNRQPEGLILNGSEESDRLFYGKPFFYPLVAAPLVRLSPQRGAFVANALLLSLAGLFVAGSLKRYLGAASPLWVSVWLFASVAFGYTFWAHADLFLMVAVAIALALLFSDLEEEGPSRDARRSVEGRHRAWIRWGLAGMLLAAVVFSRPLYLPLLAPALLAVPRKNGRLARTSFIAGAVVLMVGSAAVHELTTGSWSAYTGERRAFYSYTGFPTVDFRTTDWEEKIEESGNAAWVGNRQLAVNTLTHPALIGWNSLYFLLGRHVGVLPYFLPLILGFLGRPRGSVRWSLVLAVVASVSLFFLLRPFNFFGGGASIANRYFLPLYPALWFLVRRPVRPIWVLATAAAAMVFLWPLWRQPRAHPRRQDFTYHHVSPAAQRLLPYETTQSHLKPAGQGDVIHHQLWVKLLSPGLRSSGDNLPLRLRQGRNGTVLLGSRRPLPGVVVEVAKDAENLLQVTGATPITGATGTIDPLRYEVRFRTPRARHPMWWSWDPYYLYQVELRGAGEDDSWLGFSLRAMRAEAATSDGRRER